jgi:hypothetical protein
MDIPGESQKVGICIDQQSPISSLEQVPALFLLRLKKVVYPLLRAYMKMPRLAFGVLSVSSSEVLWAVMLSVVFLFLTHNSLFRIFNSLQSRF